jgi:hypothetical protein
MKNLIEKIKDYFLITPYTKEQILQFEKEGRLPEEFNIKRIRLKAWILGVAIGIFILYLILN